VFRKAFGYGFSHGIHYQGVLLAFQIMLHIATQLCPVQMPVGDYAQPEMICSLPDFLTCCVSTLKKSKTTKSLPYFLFIAMLDLAFLEL